MQEYCKGYASGNVRRQIHTDEHYLYSTCTSNGCVGRDNFKSHSMHFSQMGLIITSTHNCKDETSHFLKIEINVLHHTMCNKHIL